MAAGPLGLTAPLAVRFEPWKMVGESIDMGVAPTVPGAPTTSSRVSTLSVGGPSGDLGLSGARPASASLFSGAYDWLEGAVEFIGEVRAVSALVAVERFDDEDSRPRGAAAAGSASVVLEAWKSYAGRCGEERESAECSSRS